VAAKSLQNQLKKFSNILDIDGSILKWVQNAWDVIMCIVFCSGVFQVIIQWRSFMDNVIYFMVHKSEDNFNGTVAVSYLEGFCSMGFP